MMRVWVLLSIGLFIGLMAFGQQSEYYLVANFREVPGAVVTDKGEQRTTFFGSIGFRVVSTEKGLLLYLFDFNLVSPGVPTGKGNSGLISLRMSGGFDKPMPYDPRSGLVSWEFPMILHYELIDRIKGFKPAGTEGEMDMFIPFTEEMKGKLTTRFPEPLPAKVAKAGKTNVDLDLISDLGSGVLELIREIRITIHGLGIDWNPVRPAQVLKIQPVFIGTGPTDPNRTGSAWDTLMANAHNLWNRCGSVRCIQFQINNPIYLNKPAYKVLESKDEARALLAEVDVPDAVEVFVVERMTFACDWGGGACYSPGTAAAKIVTCDQQLAVPDPCPCSCWRYCPSGCGFCMECRTGAVNQYHLAHELGHALNLDHPGGNDLAESSRCSVMIASGFCADNPDRQSAKNCRNASNPLLYWRISLCTGRPDIMD